MGEGAATKVREIEAIRSRLDAQFDELSERLPPREAIVKRLIIAATAGVGAAFGLWYALHRLRTHSKDEHLKRLVREAVAEARVV